MTAELFDNLILKQSGGRLFQRLPFDAVAAAELYDVILDHDDTMLENLAVIIAAAAKRTADDAMTRLGLTTNDPPRAGSLDDWCMDYGIERAAEILTFDPAHARNISITEINTAMNMAMLMAGLQFNGSVAKARKPVKSKTMKLWTCGPAPCAVCEENDGEIVDLDEVFPSGHFAPSVHPHCQCELSLISI
jgi:hypothetical protein